MNIKEKIHADLAELGIRRDDVVLMHSSFKSLGDIEGGARTFFDAVISYLGDEGTLILPALSFVRVNRENPRFNLKQTPSCIGYLPEYFRTEVVGVKRSLHATHSCSAIGKYADEFIRDHWKDKTPVGENSPFTKLPKYDGKILFLGCSLDRNTSMHGVEELVEPPYLLDRDNKITYELDDGEGNIYRVENFRHHFVKSDGSHYQQNYSKLAELMDATEINRGRVLMADCVLMDARAVWARGIEALKKDPYFFVE